MPHHIPISVRQDHLEQLSQVTRPVDAIAELVWNGFDADASAVHVELRQNALGGVEEIVVSDNGTGIFPGHASALFGNLGESWKRERGISSGGRQLHGRKGRGRFKAFGLGTLVEWQSRCLGGQGLLEHTIRGDMSRMDGFHVTEPVVLAEGQSGTRVSVRALSRDCGNLIGERGLLALAQLFGPFLAVNPNAELWLDGERVSPALVQLRCEDLDRVFTTPDGRVSTLSLRIVEWAVEAERHLHFCDTNGFLRHSVRPGSSIRAKNCNFTVYLRSPLIDTLAAENRLAVDELDPVVGAMADEARVALRSFLQAREDGREGETVARWQAEGIHPFEAAVEESRVSAAPSSSAQARELFEQAALQVTRRWAGLGEASNAERKFLLGLLACAAQARPGELTALIDDTLGLDKRGRERLQRLAASRGGS